MALLGALAWLARRTSSLRRDRRWLAVLLPLLGLAAFAAFTYRVATAGVGGANIGAGLFIALAGMLTVVALPWILGRSLWLLTRGRPR